MIKANDIELIQSSFSISCSTNLPITFRRFCYVFFVQLIVLINYTVTDMIQTWERCLRCCVFFFFFLICINLLNYIFFHVILEKSYKDKNILNISNQRTVCFHNDHKHFIFTLVFSSFSIIFLCIAMLSLKLAGTTMYMQ